MIVQTELDYAAWVKRYDTDVMPLMKVVGGHRSTLGNDIVNALNAVGDNVTTVRVYSKLIKTVRPWDEALRGNAYSLLGAAVAYYVDWMDLSKAQKDEIKEWKAWHLTTSHLIE